MTVDPIQQFKKLMLDRQAEMVKAYLGKDVMLVHIHGGWWQTDLAREYWQIPEKKG